MNTKHLITTVACIAVWGIMKPTASQSVSPGLITEALYMYEELPGVNKSEYLSPTALKLSPDKQFLYVAENTARRLDVVKVSSNTVVSSILLPNHPTGIDVGDDGMVYVTCFSPSRPMGVVCVIDGATRTIQKIFPAGHSPRAPILRESELFICNQFENVVSVMDINSGAITDEIPAVHEPYAAALMPNGLGLLVANYLPFGRSDVDTLMASVTIINANTKQVLKNVELFNGAQSMNGICIAPNNDYAYISHIRSLHTMTPLDQLERGWINANSVSVVNLKDFRYEGSFLLDNSGAGAANPWGIECNDNHLVVTTAGTHEIHIIDRNKLHSTIREKTYDDMNYSLSLSLGFAERKRVGVKGPRAILLDGSDLYVAGYFSDEVERYELSNEALAVKKSTIALGGKQEMNIVRSGKYNFSEARDMCFQGWQSCISCHPDARADGLKWDLENDGNGNFKNDKSLLYSHVTAPSMITGVRDSAEVATRAGIQYILFWNPAQLEDRAHAIDMYLRTVRAVPSPFLDNGRLSASAQRGKVVFKEQKCDECHPGDNYFTDQEIHVGRKTSEDGGSLDGNWDTPVLHEVWRTAPYSYDGICPTMKCMYEPPISHGIENNISSQDLNDLVEYVNSL